MLTTDRLVLRPWLGRDRAPFAELNGDPRVINPPMLPTETDHLVDHFNRLWRTDGFAFAAAERRNDGLFVGMIGLQRFSIDQTVPACVEIGWRLPYALWGQGYATEAASAWLDFGFDLLDLPEIVAFTDAGNSRSQAVLRRLTMVREPARDFIHPEFADEPHLWFYALQRDAWIGRRAHAQPANPAHAFAPTA
jgi:RimJ/RimL family protein N-acetyltransferase